MHRLLRDLAASITVFLVATPLSIGIAIASGIPLEQAAFKGLLAAALGGIVVGGLSGSPLQVSGPAAGLAVLVGTIIQEQGLAGMWMATLLAGAFQIAAGLFRIGGVFRMVSPALIEGMLSGVGFLIAVAQLHILIGGMPPGSGKEFGGLINAYMLPIEIWKCINLPMQLSAAFVGLMTLLVVIAWNHWLPARWRVLPGALVGALLAALVVAGGDLSSVKRIEVPASFMSALQLPTAEVWEYLTRRGVWVSGLTLAFVASAETLLTASAVDRMQTHAPRTKYNQVLLAEGIGNVLHGFLGLLPGAGVIVRSSANVQAGAQTRLSVVLHGVWIFLALVAFPQLLSYLPLPSLAAILVYTGIRLINVQEAIRLWRVDRMEMGIFLLTMATVVVTDLLMGILVGLISALLLTLHRLSRLDVAIEPASEGEVRIKLSGAATFLRLPTLSQVLEVIAPGKVVVFSVEGLIYIDHACVEYLLEWSERYEKQGGTVEGLSAYRLWRRHYQKR